MPDVLVPTSATSSVSSHTLLERAARLVPVLRATNRLFEVSGGHGLFESAPIQRFHRDVHAGAHQGALTWHTTAEEYARRRLARV